MISDQSRIPIIFLGIAEEVQSAIAPYPLGQLNIFGLTQHSRHFVFPVPLKGYRFLFAIDINFLAQKFNGGSSIEIQVKSPEGKMFCNMKLDKKQTVENQTVSADKQTQAYLIPADKELLWQILSNAIDVTVAEPGVYSVYAGVDIPNIYIGNLHLEYIKAEPFTDAQIKAIESDPSSVKAVKFVLGCKHCPTKLRSYTALERIDKLENEGWIWQHDLDEFFICSCGDTKQKLQYLKESMHGMLGKDQKLTAGDINYVRRYGYIEINNIVSEFNNLLDDREKQEEDFQKFVESHAVLLSQFHAHKLFVKPKILGKYSADFACLNTSDQLLLIELENPNIKLFKKDGHPTADLMHAYGQVHDWLDEYRKHPHAVLEQFKLKEHEVTSVRGVVIAGRKKGLSRAHLQRHMSKPLYGDIEFLTYDDLIESLLQISRELARAN